MFNNFITVTNLNTKTGQKNRQIINTDLITFGESNMKNFEGAEGNMTIIHYANQNYFVMETVDEIKKMIDDNARILAGMPVERLSMMSQENF